MRRMPVILVVALVAAAALAAGCRDAPYASQGPPEAVEATVVPLSQAEQHIGKQIQLLLNDGTKPTGKLEAVKSSALVVQQKLTGGTMSIDIQKSRITELRVY